MPKVLKKQLETKLRLRRIQPDRKVKRKMMKTIVDLRKSNKFDMLGDLFSNYNMITRQIFSYLDFSSLQQGRLVCRSWCHFLSNDPIFWRDMLMRSKPYLKILFNKLTDGDPDDENSKETSAAFSQLANEYFACLKNQKSLHYLRIFEIFKNIQGIIFAIGSGNRDSSGFKILDYQLGYEWQYHLVGKRLYEEMKMVRKSQYAEFEWLRKHFVSMANHKDEIEDLKFEIRVVDEDYRLFSYLREYLLIVKQNMLVHIQLCKDEIQKHLKVILEDLKKKLYSDLE